MQGSCVAITRYIKGIITAAFVEVEIQPRLGSNVRVFRVGTCPAYYAQEYKTKKSILF
jgi:hypothetical protein